MAVRKMPPGTPVMVMGQVVVPPGLFGRSIYIQDGSGGIRIYLKNGELPPLSPGYWVRVKGLTHRYYGELEVKVAALFDIIFIGPGEPPEPLPVRTGDIGEALEGRLVRIAGRLTRWERNAFYLDDGSGEVKIYIKESTSIKRPPFRRGEMVFVIGVVSRYTTRDSDKGGYRILPRFQEDIGRYNPPLPVKKKRTGAGRRARAERMKHFPEGW